MALEVIFDGDIAPLNKKIKEAEANLQDFANEKAYRIKLGLDTTEVDKNIKSVKTELNSLKTTLRDTGNSFQKDFAPKVANGGNALMQFSRIAQDAPFGIMGIGNNITATVEAFGHLQRETGSAGAALKSVASSMLGSGGILLAVSLVTTGLTYMSQQGLTVSDVYKKLTGTFDENARALSKLNQEATKSATEEIVGLKALTEVAKDETLSREKRLIAVQKLQNEYPAYFGNLSKEKILNGEVSKAVLDVSKAILQRARAQAIAGKLGENAAKRLELEEKREEAILEIQRIQKQAKEDNGTFSSSFNALDLDVVIKSYKDIVAEIIKLDASSRKYSSAENKAVKDSILLLKEKEKAIKKTYNTPQVAGLDIAITQTGLDGLVELSGMLTQVSKNVQGRVGEIKTSLASIPYYFDTSGQAALLALQKFNDNMNAIIQNGIVQTLSGLSEAIGEAFATGGNVVSAVGKSLLSTLGGVLTELGKMAITTGIGILAIKTSLQTLNPYVAIAAGAALIALGGAVKGSVKGLGGSMGSGGDGSTGTSYNTGASYSSPVASSSGGGGSSYSNSGTVVFEIAGDKLIGVLSNTVSKNNRLGGSLNL